MGIRMMSQLMHLSCACAAERNGQGDSKGGSGIPMLRVMHFLLQSPQQKTGFDALDRRRRDSAALYHCGSLTHSRIHSTATTAAHSPSAEPVPPLPLRVPVCGSPSLQLTHPVQDLFHGDHCGRKCAGRAVESGEEEEAGLRHAQLAQCPHEVHGVGHVLQHLCAQGPTSQYCSIVTRYSTVKCAQGGPSQYGTLGLQNYALIFWFLAFQAHRRT